MIRRNNINPSDLDFDKISIGLHLELDNKEIEKEIKDQYKKFIELFDKKPSHIDSHQHKHLTENNLPKVVNLCKKYNLRLRLKEDKDRQIIKSNNIKTPNKYISRYPKRKEKLFSKLEDNQTEITEMVCHPGYFDKNCDYPCNRKREEELEILKSKEFNKIISQYKLINYHQL